MSDITLTPISYRVEQTHNEYFYYIKKYNRTGTFKWFVFCGTESHPDFFSIYPDFVKGFDSIYDARDQIQHYLETRFPIV